MRRIDCLVALAVAVLLGVAGPVSAETVQSQWTMAPVNGTISDQAGGAAITLTGPWSPAEGADGVAGGATRFDYAGRPSVGTAAGSKAMNPGAEEFAVAAYIKTDTVPNSGNYTPNVAQKGLYNDTGQWKMQLRHSALGTTAQCRFAGTSGHTMVSDQTTKLDNGQWHAITCWRLATSYGITVDGTTTVVFDTVGSIANTKPLRVGAKTLKAAVTDQFQGTIDCMAYKAGTSAREWVESTMPC
jgi:hypothetical protein